MKKPVYRKWWFWTPIAIVLLAIPVTWLGVRGWEAKGELESAQTLISGLKDQALAFDAKGATASLDKITAHTERAVELTSDPVWRAAELIPFLGKNLTVVRELAAASSSVMTDVAAPLLDVVGTVNPASLAPKNGAIDVAPFQKIVPILNGANAATKDAVATIDAIDTDGTLSQLVAAKDKVGGLLHDIAPLLDLGDQILPLVPGLLGADGPRNYVVMFQNSAEPRALGGTALSFAVVTVNQGKISLASSVQAGFGNFAYYDPPVIPFEPGEQDVYADQTVASFIPNVTTRPSFTFAAQVTSEMWLRTFGYRPDAIVSVDPTFLSYVLRGTEPIVLSTGDALTSETLVPLLLNGIYQRYNTDSYVDDNTAQDAVYREVVAATFAHLTNGGINPPELVKALVRGWTEHRFLFWSAREDEEAAVLKLPPNGEFPVSDATTDRVGVYIQDAVGSKLGFYLQQTLDVSQATCRSDGRESYHVSVALTHAIDQATADSLSPSIVGTWEAEKVPRAYQRITVMLYTPPGSQVLAITVDGVPIPGSANHDKDYPVDLHTLLIAPGQTVTIAYDFVPLETGKRTLEASITPLVNPTTRTSVPLDCATVPAA